MYTSSPRRPQVDFPGPCDHRDAWEKNEETGAREQRVCAGLLPHPKAPDRFLVWLIKNPALQVADSRKWGAMERFARLPGMSGLRIRFCEAVDPPREIRAR